jgi:hypothetical protein
MGGTPGRDSKEGGSRRRATKALAIVLGLGALVLLAILLAPRGAPPEPVAVSTTATTTQPPGGRATAPARPSAPRASPSGSAGVEPFQPEDMPMVPPAFPRTPFAYPPGSQPLTEGTDPATQPPEQNPVDVESGITCAMGPRIAIVHPPDPLVIDLQVQNRLGAFMPVGEPVARFRAETGDPVKGPWLTVPFADDGSGRDLASGDLHYTATLDPAADDKAMLLKGPGTHVFVEVVFMAPKNLGRRVYVTTMQYSREPDASLNGKYTDELQGGSLVVSAGVTATVAGDYRVIGSLYGGGSAIAFAAKEVHLDAGDGSIPLLFFGKILHDRGIDGPYDLRFVMLFQHAPPDDIPGDTVDPAYTTHAYSAKSFSDAPYVPPAPTFAAVDQNSPSQQGLPPPLFSEKDRQTLSGPNAPIRADVPSKIPQPVPAGTK